MNRKISIKKYKYKKKGVRIHNRNLTEGSEKYKEEIQKGNKGWMKEKRRQ